METLNLYQQIWFILIGILLVGYSILDGFDLGVGALFPFLAKNDRERDSLIRSIGPFWDGNEVWLLTGGGALFAAFPQAYATVFSGFYLALMLVLFALIFRAVSLEFRAHDPSRRKLWEKSFFIGSTLPALLFGIALGNVIQGVPLLPDMDFSGSFFTLLRPFPILTGLLGLSLFVIQGGTFAALKTTGELQKRARTFSNRMVPVSGVLFLLCFLAGVVILSEGLKKPLAWFFSSLFLFSLLLVHQSLRRAKDGKAFLFSSTAFTALWGIAGAIHFPNLVKSNGDPLLSLTISNSSSSELTLKVMLIIALIGMPLVIAYTIFSYRVFRGKAD